MATTDVTLAPNLSQRKPAGNPKEMPKFPIEANISTERKWTIEIWLVLQIVTAVCRNFGHITYPVRLDDQRPVVSLNDNFSNVKLKNMT